MCKIISKYLFLYKIWIQQKTTKTQLLQKKKNREKIPSFIVSVLLFSNVILFFSNKTQICKFLEIKKKVVIFNSTESEIKYNLSLSNTN